MEGSRVESMEIDRESVRRTRFAITENGGVSAKTVGRHRSASTESGESSARTVVDHRYVNTIDDGVNARNAAAPQYANTRGSEANAKNAEVRRFASMANEEADAKNAEDHRFVNIENGEVDAKNAGVPCQSAITGNGGLSAENAAKHDTDWDQFRQFLETDPATRPCIYNQCSRQNRGSGTAFIHDGLTRSGECERSAGLRQPVLTSGGGDGSRLGGERFLQNLRPRGWARPRSGSRLRSRFRVADAESSESSSDDNDARPRLEAP
eukprot:369547-Rhodomonas_salina.1